MAGSQEAVEPGRDDRSIDRACLADWMTANIADFRGPLEIHRFKGGQSNPTYQLITPAKRYVLRRKPSGQLLKGAHAIEREARVLESLEQVDFPVPHVYGVCTDDSVIGSWFYVMDMVDGRIFWDATFPDVPNDQRPAYFDAMNETIARLHSIDYARIGLADYGRAGGYFARQITRWSEQYLADGEAGSDPHMDRLVEWLPAHIPPSDETTIVHGDFRCDNVIFHPTQPRIVAVLDWELSTLGHPLADFSYHALMYRMPPRVIAGLLGANIDSLNIPNEADYVAAYCRRTGRDGIPAYDFYLTFNLFRIAAICHGIKGRLMRGTAASAHAQSYADFFPELAELAWRQAEHV